MEENSLLSFTIPSTTLFKTLMFLLDLFSTPGYGREQFTELSFIADLSNQQCLKTESH